MNPDQAAIPPHEMTVVFKPSTSREDAAKIMQLIQDKARALGAASSRFHLHEVRPLPARFKGHTEGLYASLHLEAPSYTVKNLDFDLGHEESVLFTRVVRGGANLGRSIREGRIARGLTAEEAAREAGVAYTTWLRIESNKPVRDMSLRAVDRLFGLPDGTTSQKRAYGEDLTAELQIKRESDRLDEVRKSRKNRFDHIAVRIPKAKVGDSNKNYERALSALSSLSADELEEIGQFATTLAKLLKFAQDATEQGGDNGER